MLKMKFKQIQFGDRFILKESEIKLKRETMTMLCGPSGSGKSTIIQAIAFQNTFMKDCRLDDEILDISNQEKIEEFKLYHLSIATQEPQLLEDLTVGNHIAMYLNLFHSNIDLNECKRLLNLDSLLEKYPMQLSGGERKRLGILLAILKNTEILIFDEPNASLDEQHSADMLQLFKLLKDQHKTLFITTHDEKLMKEADVLYRIAEQEIKVERSITAEIKAPKKQLNKKIDCKLIQKYLNTTYDHHKKYKKMLCILAVLCISFSSLSTQFNQFIKQRNNYTLSKAISNELVIYKPNAGVENESYNFDGYGQAIGSQDVDKISQIKHVAKITYRNDIELFNETNVVSPEAYDHIDYTKDWISQLKKDYSMTINYPDGLEKTVNIDDLNSLICSSYLDGVDYQNDIQTDYHQDGVYITSSLASKLFLMGKDLKEAELSFYLMIPEYTREGGVIRDNEYFITIPACTRVKVVMKIAGVLKENKMGLACSYEHVMYLKQSVMQSYVEKYRKKEPLKLYGAIEEDENAIELRRDFYTEMTENIKNNGRYTSFYTLDYKPWEPAAYTVLVDDASNVSSVINQISAMGYSIYGADMDYHALSEGTKNLQQLMLWASMILTVIVFIVLILMKYNEREKEKQISLFFEHMGFSNQHIMKIKIRKYAARAKTIVVYTFMMMACGISLDIAMKFIGFTFHLKPFIIAFIMVALIEFIVPIFIEKRLRHDKTS